jgi:uncharacterized protein GlcG (DUF336 family)
MKRYLVTVALGLVISTPTLAQQTAAPCSIAPGIVSKVQNTLATVVNGQTFPDKNGGLFSPNRMWSAVVDRQGVLCSVISSDPDAWPGSRSIAIAKASTANNFSNNLLALSTANLYSFTQPANDLTTMTSTAGNVTTFPAGSLYGLNNSNPFNPAFQPQGTGVGGVPGGIITFGGGVALYQGGKIIGGLGVSGDTACADHAIAFRMRKTAGLDGTPGPGGAGADNIVYLNVGELPHDLGHPHCKVSGDVTP